ncbi:IS1634 family transposase [bacterium]|nr:IS1634 family transposase [bacterium]
MHLMIDKGKYGHNTLYVYKSFRNENGKATSKCVERLGRYDELAKTHEDPIAWAKAYIEELNRQEEKNQKITLSYATKQLIETGESVLVEGGYLFLQKYFYSIELNKICKKISSKYSFKYDLTNILALLIYGRILNPTSKSGTFEYAQKMLENYDFQLQDIYRALEVIAKEKDFIQAELYKNSKKFGKRNDKILYYDCTNYYFEIEHESDMRKYGKSKENRPNPIIEMGLFMDGNGIPLAFCLHDGNTNEQKTLQPLEKQIIEDFGNAKFIVCTDAGLSSVANRKFNNIDGRAFITAQSIKKMKGFQKEWVLSPKGWHLHGIKEEFDLEQILNDKKNCEKYKNCTFYKERWFNENDIEQRYIVTFSLKYMNYQRTIRNEQVERAEKAIYSSIKSERSRQSDYKRFITKTSVTKEGEIAEDKVYSLNTERIADEEQYDGFYCVATNLEDDASDIIRINGKRWEIEESFRIMKTEFKARPVYLSRSDRITAHFTTCFLSLVLYRYFEKDIGHKYTCPELLEQLKMIKFYKTKEGYLPAYTRNELTDDLHSVFGQRTDYQITTFGDMKKIISFSKKNFT